MVTDEIARTLQKTPNPISNKSEKIRVLVVDDERGARMALEIPLRLSGYDVVAVSNGQTAIKIAQKDYFDILLTDVYMPQMNGLELVKEFRIFNPDTRIIVLTAQGSLETAMEAVKQGAFDFIAKPFDIEKCLAPYYSNFVRFVRFARIPLILKSI